MKDMQEFIKNVYKVNIGCATYGRKIDVMVTNNDKTRPLYAIERKKQICDLTKFLLQQTKDLRINKCHVNDLLNLELSEKEIDNIFVTGIN